MYLTNRKSNLKFCLSILFWMRDWIGLCTTKASGFAMGKKAAQVSVNNKIDCISFSLTQKLPSDFALHTQKDFISSHYKTFLLVMTFMPPRNKAPWLSLDFISRDCCMLSMAHKRKNKNEKQVILFLIKWKIFHVFYPRDLRHLAF